MKLNPKVYKNFFVLTVKLPLGLLDLCASWMMIVTRWIPSKRIWFGTDSCPLTPCLHRICEAIVRRLACWQRAATATWICLSRSNPTWYFFPITIFYIKCMDLTTWSTCKSLYINSSFCTCQSQVLYLFYLHLPFANTHVVKYHESSVHPSHVWNVRINLDAAINVKSAMFKTICCLKIAGGFTSQCIGDYQGAPINQPAYCNQMGLEHRWCESSTWIDVWHILAPCMVNNSYFF